MVLHLAGGIAFAFGIINVMWLEHYGEISQPDAEEAEGRTPAA